jgi:hypothetical protein
MSKINLMGEDGVTDSTGESSRPLETWFEKGPNLTRVQRSAEHKEGAWVRAVLQNRVRHWSNDKLRRNDDQPKTAAQNASRCSPQLQL